MKSKKTIISSFLAYTMAGALCLSIGACSESDEMGDGKYKVSLSPNKLGIESTGSTQLNWTATEAGYTFACSAGAKTYSFKITAENTPWTITGTPSWMNISPTTGDSDQGVEMSVEANTPTETERTATITLKSTDPNWEYSIPITVTQAAASPKLETVSYFGNFNSGDDTKECEFAANFTPSIAYEDNDGNWFSATAERNEKEYYGMAGYTLHVTVKPNEATSWRTGYVLLQYNGNTLGKVEVSQYAFSPSASFSSNYIWLEKKGETREIPYSANFTPTVKSDDIKSWCNVSIDTNSKTITITAKENTTGWQRSGYIYLLYKDKEKASIEIYQYGY